jgi:hypothetical protein
MTASNILHRTGVALLASLFSAAALAQNPPQRPVPNPASSSVFPACPEGAVSIYFGSGDIAASAQTMAVIERISEAAQACRPDHIDLVAYVNPPVEGEGALSLSLGRLEVVARELAAAGVPVPALRTATRDVAEHGAGSLIQIDIVMRSEGQALPAEREPAPAGPRARLRGDPV